MDSSVASTEEPVAGDEDQCPDRVFKNWVYILELKLLAVGSLSSHGTFSDFGFLTCKMRALSTPGEMPLQETSGRGFIQQGCYEIRN